VELYAVYISFQELNF